MKPQSADTDIKIEAELIERFRGMSSSERFFKAAHLSDLVLNQSKRAIKEANPHLNELEQKILFISIHYGDELAEHVRRSWTIKDEQK